MDPGICVYRFNARLVDTRIGYYNDYDRGGCMVNVPDMIKALIRNVKPETIASIESSILDNDSRCALRPNGDCGDLFVILEHCESSLDGLLGERAGKALATWVSMVGEEQEIEWNENNNKKKTSRKHNADWQALVNNRHRKRRKAQDPDYVPQGKGKEEEEDEDEEEEEGIDALIAIMSAEDDEAAEEDMVQMTWAEKKDFVSFNMSVAKELRKQWVTFKDDSDPKLAGAVVSLLSNTMRAIAPFWPATSVATTTHCVVVAPARNDDPRDPPVTISERLVIRGYNPEELEEDHFKRIGIEAARLYEHEYGARPEVTYRKHEGVWQSVNKYKRSAAHNTIDKAIRRVMEGKY
jgi:hypothetical protein